MLKINASLMTVLLFAMAAFGQSTSATVSGTVSDSSDALIPGVTITATNEGTGVATSVITNEAGAYTFASLVPGNYRVSAVLPGFQTRTFTGVELGNAARLRLNFTLQVASQATSVEVSIAVDSLLATSSSSVGEILGQQRVQDLPTVSNNVLDLYRLMPGIRVNDDGVSGSFAGLSAQGTVNVQRDGVDAAGGSRWGSNALSATYMSPDLIAEARLIVSPVDVELGRGNAQIQFLTRSGGKDFHGTGAWYVRNSALDSNTWNNNRQVDPKTGAWKPTTPDWSNNHQFSASLGGPIVQNKTFFFALWDHSLVNGRTTPNSLVLTPCARRGIFRYYEGWANGNAVQQTVPGTTTPTIAVVDAVGAPVQPATNPDGSAYTGRLRYASVFGPLVSDPQSPDCSDAVVQGNPWDPNRRAQDPTGYVAKVLGMMPLPNNYELAGSDGLNTAGFRWTRNENGGTESIFGTNAGGIASLATLGRKQINAKIDHIFNANNKLGVSYTYERSAGNASFEAWPDGFRGAVVRRPQTLAVNLTSTLSQSLVNEVRTGMRRIGGNSYNGLNNPKTGSDALAFFPNVNGYPVVPLLGNGQVSFQTTQPLGGGNTSAYNDTTVLWTFADTLSWTRGAHTFKFGGESRFGHSLGYDAGIAITTTPRATGGETSFSPIAGITSANMPGLIGLTTSANNGRMRNLLNFLSGSLASVTQFNFMQDPTKLDAFEDYKTFPQRVRDTHQNEFSAFLKDDWKVRRSLTLNLGLRWDYYGVPYDGNGLTPRAVGGPWRVFGISGNSFEDWMKPGVRGELTTVEFVGKNSPNPKTSWYENEYNNFGPAIGFAWQVPWFGAGKTTVRGGYQVTFNAGQVSNSITQENVVPSSTNGATNAGNSTDNTYLDLTKLPSLVPVFNIIRPMQPIPVTDRSQQIYNPQPNLRNPYAQNLTLSVTRAVGSKLTVDMRYVGTLGRKQWNAAFQINQPNFLFNGLKEAFDAARAGDDSSPALKVMEDMLKGVNLVGTGFGPVGTTFNGVLQTAGMHLRGATLTQTSLANGNYSTLAATLNTLNYNSASNQTLPPIQTGTNGGVLRVNGFPENFIVTNPQFSNVFMIASINSNNYHSMEAQITLRETHGISMQSSYTWSKNLGISYAVGSTYTNAVDRHADYALLPDTRVHDFRTNGSFTLPIGPNRLFFANSSGVLARALEDWKLGWILNVNSGQPISIGAQSMLYANGTADIVGNFDRKGTVEFKDGANSGTYYMGGNLKQVRDPQCANVTTSQNLNNLCNLNAIADTNGQILLQNPLPGRRGSIGWRTLEGPGRWRFDANLSKSFKITESKTLQFRMDATDVLNHPEPSNPVLDINTTNFGSITGANAKSTLHRQFQAQMRLNF